MRVLDRGCLVTVSVLVGAGVARADRYESSLHVQAVGGLAQTGDVDGRGLSSAPLGGLEVRASYATSDWYQYDLAVTGFGTGTAGFAAAEFTLPGGETVAGPFEVGSAGLRVDGGVTVRLGVQVIPTFRLGVGFQARRIGSPTVETSVLEVDAHRPGRIERELVGLGSVGLDYRFNRRLIAGAAVGGVYAVPVGGVGFRSLEATAHVAYYWYPLWF